MWLRNTIFLCIISYLNLQFDVCNAENVTYIDIEHPKITFLNTTFFKTARVSSLRLSHGDPRHYGSFYIEALVTVGNNLMIDIYFYQLLTNQYKPSFIEFHTGFCDLVNHEWLGVQLKKSIKGTCPYPPGHFNTSLLTLPYVPKNFPFTQGRIYINTTMVVLGARYSAGRGYVDIEIKRYFKNEKKTA